MMHKALSFLFAIMTLTAVTNGVLAADERKGREVYDLHCATCHGTNGVSPDPMVPNFADGDALFLMDSELLQRIGDGSDTMPAFRGLLNAEEMRDVIAYIRTF